MSKWFKVAAPLAIAGILVTALTIGLRSPSGHAECSQPGPFQGTASSSVTYTFDYCGGDDWWVSMSLTWQNASKDLSLTVIQPDGSTRMIDTHGANWEFYNQAAPLGHGTWTLVVNNPGSGNVKFNLAVTFATG